MDNPELIIQYFEELVREESASVKRLFEGDYSDAGNFSILSEKFISDDDNLFDIVLPELIRNLEAESFSKTILNNKKESLKSRIKQLFKDVELMPERFDFLSYIIEHEERSLSALSLESIKANSDCIFEEVISSVKSMEDASERQSKENYFFLSLLGILFEKYKAAIAESKKYSVPSKKENIIYKYYESLNVDLLKQDSQYSKYDLYSVDSESDILVGLPSRVIDRENNLQFFISTPEHILSIFVDLLKGTIIKNLAFLAESEVIIESEEQIFFLLEGNRPTPPKLLSDLINDTRGVNVREAVTKKPEGESNLPYRHSVGRFFESGSEDSVWYFIDEHNIEFEEIAQDFVGLDDCVVTQLIHLEYIVENDTLFVSHMDHEYIFYEYHEFEQRLDDFTQKGHARKRIKTFKIDNSKIPFVLDNGVYFLYTVIDAYFSDAYFIKSMLLELIGKAANK